ncbi:helix-turn-helix transcriptional regulator [Bradyrhizobium sp. BRP19]|uniref:helix-turn-helix transcriptional regulator n=1 Tax=Bradyrhizobium sp. BRP19 TaxID=2793823 RepID=UPI001CD4DA48
MQDLRLRKSWSQYDLADESQLRQALVSNIEAEKANPTLLSLHKIASALGVHVAELMLPQGTVLAQGAKPAATVRKKGAKKRPGRPLKPLPR